MSLPPVFAASALYDSLLQGALRQFFGRATFETEPIPSLSSDGRLAIEPTSDPSVLSVRWFGSRHVLHVPARRPFTAHEVRLARAIGAVLAARYRAIFDPRQMLERGDLFGGAIEDRYVGAFLDIATAHAYRYSQSLTTIKSFYRLCDGIETLFLVNRSGIVLDIVEIARYTAPAPLQVPCATRYRPHAMATTGTRNLSIVLSPSHEIK